jgi:hypothetical protein
VHAGITQAFAADAPDLEAGIDLPTVQTLMRHALTETTRGYLHLSGKRARRMLVKHEPFGGKQNPTRMKGVALQLAEGLVSLAAPN